MKTRSTLGALALCLLLVLIAPPARSQNNGMWRVNGNNNVSTGHFIGTTDPSPLILKTNGTEHLRISPSGSVQLADMAGTQPAVLAVGTDGTIFKVIDPGVDSLFTCSTKLYRASGNYLTPDCFIGSTNKAPFRIVTNNVERMRVTEGGDVGIGTTTPQTPLHVYSPTNPDLRIQGTTLQASPQVSMAIGNGSQSLLLATFKAGINASTFHPEARIDVNDASGLSSMKTVLKLEASTAELQVRLGIGMAPVVDEQLSLNGTAKLFDRNNPANYLRMGHDATSAFIEHATPVPSGTMPSRLFINPNGGRTDFGGDAIFNRNVGIGTSDFIESTTSKDYRLSVEGRIRCKEIRIYSGWADYVFSPEYELMPLSEVERYIQANGHLPGLPSAADVACDGIDVGTTQAMLLEKIEELTLHVIRLERENVELRNMSDD